MRVLVLILIGFVASLQSELKVVRKVDPQIPAIARAARVQAPVRLSVRVSPEGRVEDARILQGHALLNEAAIQAIRLWRFESSQSGGTVEVTLPFAYGPGHTVTGRVTDSAGRPLTGFRVAAVEYAYEAGRLAFKGAERTEPSVLLTPGPSIAPGTTDDRGIYRLFGLTTGEYFIVAASPAPAPGFAPQEIYAMSTFHPGVTDESRAIRVKVSGERDAVADIVVPRLPAVSVSGKVVAPAGAVSGPVILRLDSLDPRPEWAGYIHSFSGELSDRGEMSFVLPGVRPGRYELMIHMGAPTRDIAYSHSHRQVLEVGQANVGDLNVVLHSTADIRGRVVADGAVSLPQSLRVMIRRQEPYIIGRSSTPSQDGSFVLGGLPEGRYAVTVTSLPADSYVSDMLLGSQSIFNDLTVPVHVEAPPPLNIILRKGGGAIEGVVQDEQKRGVPSTLVLVPSPARRKNSMLYKTAYATAGGRFRINAVAPGEYKLFAFEIPPPSGAMEYDGFISGYEDRGVSVTVSDGDLSNVTVAEIPAP